MNHLPITMEDQQRFHDCCVRELQQRRVVYPRLVRDQRMTPKFADKQIKAMEDMVEWLAQGLPVVDQDDLLEGQS
jgi:hypothetical protein